MPKKPKICLTISHSLFLTREQRYALNGSGETVVTCAGISVPVWCKGSIMQWYANSLKTSEPAEEIFCQYRISNRGDNYVVRSSANGYDVAIAAGVVREALKDIVDKGSEFLTFINYGEVYVGEKKRQVVHFVTIQDIDVLNKSITML